MYTPFLRFEVTGDTFALPVGVTTVGRGEGVDIVLHDPSVSRLHAEIIRRGPHVYVFDSGLSRNGTRVNGRPISCRLLEDDDVLSFGQSRCRVGGIGVAPADDTQELRRSATPVLTRRETDVLTALCRQALKQDAFVTPATAKDIADELVVTEAAVKQHLLRLYQKFRIGPGTNRRARLANEVISAGLVRPEPVEPAGAQHPASTHPGSGYPGSSYPSASYPARPSGGAAAVGGEGRLGSSPGTPPAGVRSSAPLRRGAGGVRQAG